MPSRQENDRGSHSPFPPGPLGRCAANSRWPTDGEGRAIFLAGSHTWAVFQERGVEGRTPDFDYEAWLDMMAACGHNYLRLWTWEHALGMPFASPRVKIRYTPLPWLRTGPGKAADGLDKFDLTRFDPAYFERLRQRALAAGRRGIYVSVMFFQGFSLFKPPPKDHLLGSAAVRSGVDELDEVANPWHGHPFNPRNNINGLDLASAADTGHEIHTLGNPELTRIQEAYVRQVIDTLGDLDHVFWEIANEAEWGSVAFQHHMVNYVRDYQRLGWTPPPTRSADRAKKRPGRRAAVEPVAEAAAPREKLIGMSGSPIDAEALRSSPADWIAPPLDLDDPPAAEGGKIVFVDTDHCGPWRCEPTLPWKALARGCCFCAMDPWRDVRFKSPAEPVADWADLRRAMGAAVAASQRVPLDRMRPVGALCSTGFALADAPRDFTVLLALRNEGDAPLNVRAARPDARYALEWIHPVSGRVLKRDATTADPAGTLTLKAPHAGPVALIAQCG